MKRSTLGVIFILTGYLVIFGIIISAVKESYGSNSIAMYITVIAMGPIGLTLIATHKGLDNFLEKLNKYDE